MFSLSKWKMALPGRRLQKVGERRISEADIGQEDKTFSALLEALREMKCSMVAYQAMGNFTEEDIHGVKVSTEPYCGEPLLIYDRFFYKSWTAKSRDNFQSVVITKCQKGNRPEEKGYGKMLHHLWQVCPYLPVPYRLV